MTNKYITFKNVFLKYKYDCSGFEINDINLNISRGEYISLVGRNGSGKSTLARLINGILSPDSGIITVNSLDTSDKNNILSIRREVGLVFSNPESQLAGSTVGEEVAFGPENLGFKRRDIKQIVSESLNFVGFDIDINSQSSVLSGGQKQKLLISSILAMKPKCIIFDESTSMIDDSEKDEIIALLNKINDEQNITIINITHNASEVLNSRRTIAIDNGKIIFDGTPMKFFDYQNNTGDKFVDVPEILELFYSMKSEFSDTKINYENINDIIEIITNKIID